MVQLASGQEPVTESIPPPSPVSGLNALRNLVEPVKGRLLGALGLSGLSGIAWIATLVLAARIVAILLDESTADLWFTVIWTGVAAVAATVLKTFASSVSHHAAFDHEVIMRRQLTEHLGQLPIGTVQGIGTGGLKKVIQDDVRGMHAMIADAPPFVGALVTAPIFGLIVMFWIDWRLGLVAFAVLPLVLGLMAYLMRDYPELQKKFDAAQESINSAVVEYVQGMAEVRTFDGASDSFSTYVHRNAKFTEFLREWFDRSRSGALVARILVAPLTMIVVVIVAGTLMNSAGLVQVSNVVAIALLSPLIVESIYPLMWMNEFLNRSKLSATRIHEVLDLPTLEEPDVGKEPSDGSVRFESVTFSYDSTREPALHDVSFEVPAGTVCALVGRSGSGKSTIARLVPRFFDVGEGRVLVGGVDVSDFSTDRLLRQVALVFQEPFLFAGSIRENLTLGAPTAGDEEVQAAAKAARAHDFIVELPEGYDTQVDERGASLSGGQRQRLTIARALLADAPIVILDEATSFADPENEAEIQSALAELAKGKTVLVVAHRLSTIADVDQIVVLEEGRVVESGSHESLLEARSTYASMWEKHERAMSWGIRHDRVASS